MLFKRSDGWLARDVPAYRLMMPFVMTSKNTSQVYFSPSVDMEKALAGLR